MNDELIIIRAAIDHPTEIGRRYCVASLCSCPSCAE